MIKLWFFRGCNFKALKKQKICLFQCKVEFLSLMNTKSGILFVAAPSENTACGVLSLK